MAECLAQVSAAGNQMKHGSCDSRASSPRNFSSSPGYPKRSSVIPRNSEMAKPVCFNAVLIKTIMLIGLIVIK